MSKIDMATKLERIADAGRRADGSDIPLGETCREAARMIRSFGMSPEEVRLQAAAKALSGSDDPSVSDYQKALEVLRSFDAACVAPASHLMRAIAAHHKVPDGRFYVRHDKFVDLMVEGKENSWILARCNVGDAGIRSALFLAAAANFTRAVLSAPDVDEQGWIVSDGDGTKFRTWEGGFSTWTENRDLATRYLRRQDAEAVHQEDEDAWLIVPYGRSSSAAG